MKLVRVVSISLGLSLLTWVSLAHEGVRHEESQERPSLMDVSLLSTINAEYITAIRPIFKRACFDCHSTQAQYPWYYGIPGVRQWIDHDVRDSLKHIDLTNDFPFKGHGSPQKDFEAIRKVILDNSMPPFRYKMMHWNAGVTALEKKDILKWIDENQRKMQN